MENCILYDKCKKMIYQKAGTLARKYHMEQDELISQGNLIFVKTLNKFNPEKSSFSTYLYESLKDLRNYCETQRKHTLVGSLEERNYFNNFEKSDETNEEYIEEDFCKTIIQIENQKELSEKAQKMLCYILSRDWEIFGYKKQHKANFRMMKTHFKTSLGWGITEIKNAWKELSDWWDRNYCYY